MPHKWVLAALLSAIATAMVVSALTARWPDIATLLLGNIGVLPFVVAIATLVFLGLNSRYTARSLDNTRLTLEHSRNAELGSRFQKGLELLQSTNGATRIGGIAVLRDVAAQAPMLYWETVSTVLVSFVETGTRSLYDQIILAASQPPATADADLVVSGPQCGESGPDILVAIETLALKSTGLRTALAAAKISPKVTLCRVALVGHTFNELDMGHIDIRYSVVQNCAFLLCNLEGATHDYTGFRVIYRGSTMTHAYVSAIPCNENWRTTVRFLVSPCLGIKLAGPNSVTFIFWECDVTSGHVFAGGVEFEASWYFVARPYIWMADNAAQPWDIEDVAGREPLGYAFQRIPYYRESSQS